MDRVGGSQRHLVIGAEDSVELPAVCMEPLQVRAGGLVGLDPVELSAAAGELGIRYFRLKGFLEHVFALLVVPAADDQDSGTLDPRPAKVACDPPSRGLADLSVVASDEGGADTEVRDRSCGRSGQMVTRGMAHGPWPGQSAVLVPRPGSIAGVLTPVTALYAWAAEHP